MKDQTPGRISNQLEYWIRQRGYKKYEVVEATQIPLRTLNDYCRGRTAIPRYRLEALAAFLECPLSALLDEAKTTQNELTPQGLNAAPSTQTTTLIERSEHYQSAKRETNETSSTAEDIIEKIPRENCVVPVYLSLSGFEMVMKSRRQVLQDTLNAACAAIILSPYELLPKESQAQLALANVHSSYLDDEAINDLSTITARYWSISRNAPVDVLSGISGHFANIVQFLKDPHPDAVYQRLCSLASESALILGKTFSEIKEYNLAWSYYKFCLKVALDAGNTDLWAAGIGRVALLLIYWGEPHNALPFLQEAQRTTLHDQRIGLWLSAIEAEIHASLGNKDACVRLLENTKAIPLPVSLEDDFYATGFNPSRAAGYEGACFVRLHKPEQALPALQQAFALCDPTSLHRQSMLIADIGIVHAQLGDPKEACRFLHQSLGMIMQTKSLVVLQRVCKARNDLKPWKNSEEVKSLDDQITDTFTALTKLKEKAQV